MGIDLSALKQEFTRLESQGQSGFLDNFVPMPEGDGTVTIRILPPTDGLNGLPCARTRTHKLNGKTFHSSMQLVDGKWVGNCPVNNYYRSLWKQSETAGGAEKDRLIQEARSIKPVERYYFNAIVRQMTTKEGRAETNVGPKIYSCGKQVWEKILRAIVGAPEVNEDGLGDVTDLENGRDFKVIKRMTNGNRPDSYPNYVESKFLNEGAAGKQAEVEKWMNNRHDLKSLVKVESFDELARQVRIHRGLEKDPDTSFDVGNDAPAAAPARQQTREPVAETRSSYEQPKPKAKPKPVDDDDFDMGDDEFIKKLQNLG